MIPLSIHLDGDGAFDDLPRDAIAHGHATAIAYLDRGMASGKGSIALRVDVDGGGHVVAETSWALLHAAVRAIEARHGAPE
jgi:hypothetical protein